jgi:hypothetical protein
MADFPFTDPLQIRRTSINPLVGDPRDFLPLQDASKTLPHFSRSQQLSIYLHKLIIHFIVFHPELTKSPSLSLPPGNSPSFDSSALPQLALFPSPSPPPIAIAQPIQPHRTSNETTSQWTAFNYRDVCRAYIIHENSHLFKKYNSRMAGKIRWVTITGYPTFKTLTEINAFLILSKSFFRALHLTL